MKAQNPSPQTEAARAHGRIKGQVYPGLWCSAEPLPGVKIQIYRPRSVLVAEEVGLLLHFHGAAHIAAHAVHLCPLPLVAASIQLGAGSARYERPFVGGPSLEGLVAAVAKTAGVANLAPVYISAFSAGYGAVHSLLKGGALPDGILLLDGLHSGYVPTGRVLAEGGQLEESYLAPFLRFARRAVQGKCAMVISHSAVFPGTYASTTECVDWMVGALRLERRAVLEWGPLGMQKLSEARGGRFAAMGFAGNSGPDHVDHLHGLFSFLDVLVRI